MLNSLYPGTAMTKDRAEARVAQKLHEFRKSAGKNHEELIADRYLRVRSMASGSCADISLGADMNTDRPVVLKEGKNNGRWIWLSFEYEADVLSRVEHPNLVRLLDADFTRSEGPLLVLDYIPGPNLHQFMKGGCIGTVTGLKMVRKILEALEALHTKGVYHRDLKPKNVVIDRSDNEMPVIIDPGYCKIVGARDWTSEEHVQFGNPIYRASKHFGGDDVLGDLYSVAVMLYDISQTRGHISHAVSRPKLWLLRATDLLLLEDVKSGRLPREIYEIIRRSADIQRSNNFQSAAEMVSAVDHAISILGKE